MLTSEEEECATEEQDQELAIILQGEEGELIQIEDNCEVSIHAITGTQGVHTMKLQGHVKNAHISMLLDSGSTHNFISQALVRKLQLTTEPCSPIKVTVANGDSLQCDKKNFTIQMEVGLGRISDFHVCNSSRGYDAVLGI